MTENSLKRSLFDLDVRNERRYFPNAYEALDYMSSLDAKPFMILSDVNSQQLPFKFAAVIKILFCNSIIRSAYSTKTRNSPTQFKFSTVLIG